MYGRRYIRFHGKVYLVGNRRPAKMDERLFNKIFSEHHELERVADLLQLEKKTDEWRDAIRTFDKKFNFMTLCAQYKTATTEEEKNTLEDKIYKEFEKSCEEMIKVIKTAMPNKKLDSSMTVMDGVDAVMQQFKDAKRSKTLNVLTIMEVVLFKLSILKDYSQSYHIQHILDRDFFEKTKTEVGDLSQGCIYINSQEDGLYYLFKNRDGEIQKGVMPNDQVMGLENSSNDVENRIMLYLKNHKQIEGNSFTDRRLQETFEIYSSRRHLYIESRLDFFTHNFPDSDELDEEIVEHINMDLGLFKKEIPSMTAAVIPGNETEKINSIMSEPLFQILPIYSINGSLGIFTNLAAFFGYGLIIVGFSGKPISAHEKFDQSTCLTEHDYFHACNIFRLMDYHPQFFKQCRDVFYQLIEDVKKGVDNGGIDALTFKKEILVLHLIVRELSHFYSQYWELGISLDMEEFRDNVEAYIKLSLINIFQDYTSGYGPNVEYYRQRKAMNKEDRPKLTEEQKKELAQGMNKETVMELIDLIYFSNLLDYKIPPEVLPKSNRNSDEKTAGISKEQRKKLWKAAPSLAESLKKIAIDFCDRNQQRRRKEAREREAEFDRKLNEKAKARKIEEEKKRKEMRKEKFLKDYKSYKENADVIFQRKTSSKPASVSYPRQRKDPGK